MLRPSRHADAVRYSTCRSFEYAVGGRLPLTSGPSARPARHAWATRSKTTRLIGEGRRQVAPAWRSGNRAQNVVFAGPMWHRRRGGSMSHRTLLVVVVFVSIFTYDLFRPTDIDFWWHLRTGQLIAESGAVPRTDPFSFTAAGRPWVAHEWLWELGAFHLYRLGGYRAAVLLSAIIVTLAYVILYRLLRHLGANEIAAAGLVLWAAFLGLPNLGARPREFTFLFFAFFLDLLYR